MTTAEPTSSALTAIGRARAETVMRAGCLDALRIALTASGYPVALVRDRARNPDRLWIESKLPGTKHASIAVGCILTEDDGWWFVQPSGRRLGPVDDLDEVLTEIAYRFND